MNLTGMLEQQVEQYQKEMLSKLPEDGSPVGNMSLQRDLGWNDNELYWAVKRKLLDSNQIKSGRGKGGAIMLFKDSADTTPSASPAQIGQAVADLMKREEDLYEPIRKVLANSWVLEQGFGGVGNFKIVEKIARQGRRFTGGVWTRPDLVVIGGRVFQHLPGKYLDVITFEVKPAQGFNVTSVHETLAHRRSATQSYLWLHCLSEEEKESDEFKDIESEAENYGIGLIAATAPDDLDTWDTIVKPTRVEPDPQSLETFISQQLSGTAQTAIASWLR